jgi:hypothetical protein
MVVFVLSVWWWVSMSSFATRQVISMNSVATRQVIIIAWDDNSSGDVANSLESHIFRIYIPSTPINRQELAVGVLWREKKNLVAGVPWQKKSGVAAGFRYSATDFVSCSSFSICSRNSNHIVLFLMRRLFCPLYLYNPTRCYVDAIEQLKIRLPWCMPLR